MLESNIGHVVLIMAPMASGKGCLMEYIQENFPQVTRLVSCTTRERRPQEIPDVDYHFISRDEFQRRIEQGDFIEWAEFSINLYGTLRSELMDRLGRSEIVMNEIDLQGVVQLMSIVPKVKRTIIYIDAGDWDTLKKRALLRAPISDIDLEQRLLRYREETAFRPNVDYIIHNNDGELEKAKAHIHEIIQNIIIKTSAIYE